MLGNTYFFKLSSLVFLLVCVLLWKLFFSPETLTLRGTLPPGFNISAVTVYSTTSPGPLCRDLKFSDLSLSSYGTSRTRVSTVADATGQYTLDVPLENKSLWCKWTGGGVYIKAWPPSKKVDYSAPFDVAEIYRDTESPAEAVTVQCANTYYLTFRHDNTTSKQYRTLCRNTNLPFPEDASATQYMPEITIPLSSSELILHIQVKYGPIYDIMKGPAQYWREFDAEQDAIREEQGMLGATNNKPVKIIGCYSSFDYDEKSDALNGFQVTLIDSKAGYYALVEQSEKWPTKPFLVPANVEGSKVTFSISSIEKSLGKFEGRITRRALIGSFSNTDQQLNLRRQRNYWEETPPSMRKVGCFSSISPTAGKYIKNRYRLFMMFTSESPYLLLQRISEQPEIPLLVPVDFKKSQLTFTITPENSAPKQFSGDLTDYTIKGTFDDSDELLIFKREECSWQ